MNLKVDFTAICIYVATLSAALLSAADMLPLKWLPYIIVAGKLADAFTPRAAKRRQFTIPPAAGRGQDGRVRLSTLLLLLTLCLPLPFLTTGCPKQAAPQNANTNANTNTTPVVVARLQKRARKAATALDHAATDIEALALMTAELRAFGLVSDAGARDIQRGLLDANDILSEGADQALSYGSLDEFASAGLAEHLGKFRKALARLNESGTLHIKNPKRHALFSGLLIAADIAISRVESDASDSIPEGVTYTLDATIRRKLERARDTFARAGKRLSEDLARPVPKDAAAV
jgi:hypothetical protein